MGEPAIETLSLVPRLRLGAHFSEALLRHAKQEAELPESSVPGGDWDGVVIVHQS